MGRPGRSGKGGIGDASHIIHTFVLHRSTPECIEGKFPLLVGIRQKGALPFPL